MRPPSRMGTPRLYLAAVHAPDWLGLGARLALALRAGFAGVDVRVANLARGPSKAERELAEQAASCGLDVRCHSWVGYRSGDVAAVTPALGRRDGDLAAAACVALGASSFGANAERDVWRGPNGTACPGAVDYLNEQAERFLAAAPRARQIDYVGFADPAHHYREIDADGDGDIDTEIPEYQRIIYSRVGVMAYQSTEADLRKTLNRAVKRWPEHAAAKRIVPWFGVGRLDAGKAVGNAIASCKLAREFGEATFYVGFGAIGQLLDGNPQHESLVSLAKSLRVPGGEA